MAKPERSMEIIQVIEVRSVPYTVTMGGEKNEWVKRG